MRPPTHTVRAAAMTKRAAEGRACCIVGGGTGPSAGRGGVRSLSARRRCGGRFLWDNRITRSGDQRELNFQLCFDSEQSLSRKRASARTLSSPPREHTRVHNSFRPGTRGQQLISCPVIWIVLRNTLTPRTTVQ